jgi:hypothetical protein
LRIAVRRAGALLLQPVMAYDLDRIKTVHMVRP